MNSPADPATVEASLRLGVGWRAAERDALVDRLGTLDARLRSFPEGSVELELSVKERDTHSQKTTLEAWVAGTERVVATSSNSSVDEAVTEVRDHVIRQLTDAKNKTEPRQNRQRRNTEP